MMIKILNKAKIIGLGLFCLFPLLSIADTTPDPTGIAVTFNANIIQQSCSVADTTPVEFDDIEINTSAGFGSAGGQTTDYKYFSVAVTCAAPTTLSLKLTGEFDIYNSPKYLRLDTTCPEIPCASGFAVATYMTTDGTTPPIPANLLTINTDFVNSLETTPGTDITLWFAANLVQTKPNGGVTTGTYTATGTLNIRYN